MVDRKRGKLNEARTEIPTANQDRLRREAWTLSDTGNWTKYQVDADDGDYAGGLDQDRTHNKVNEIFHETPGAAITELQGQAAWANPAHDARGNMTAVPKPGGMAGTYACTYDAWNRLVEVREGEAIIAQYRYDVLGRRIRKLTPSGGNWTVREFYYNASWQLLEVRQAADISRAGSPPAEPGVAAAVHEQYIWSARYIDAPILRDRDAGEGGGLGKGGSDLDERLYYLTDAHMCVMAVVDAGGAAVERYCYDPYGRVTILNGAADRDEGVSEWSPDADGQSDVDNAILFCGYWRDSETGLDHIRHRVYHPLLGRWLQRDPLGYVDGMGVTEYCQGRPETNRDPSGLDAYLIPDDEKRPTRSFHVKVAVDITMADGTPGSMEIDYAHDGYVRGDSCGSLAGLIGGKARLTLSYFPRPVTAKGKRRIRGDADQDQRLVDWALGQAGLTRAWVGAKPIGDKKEVQPEGKWATYSGVLGYTCTGHSYEAIATYLGHDWGYRECTYEVGYGTPGAWTTGGQLFIDYDKVFDRSGNWVGGDPGIRRRTGSGISGGSGEIQTRLIHPCY